jgi:hypothetical protein
MKKIRWNGFGRREIYGYAFTPGQVIEVTDDEQALDILTQPGEDFSEVIESEAELAAPAKKEN